MDAKGRDVQVVSTHTSLFPSLYNDRGWYGGWGTSGTHRATTNSKVVLRTVPLALPMLPLTVSRQSGACLCLPSGAAGDGCSPHTRRPAAEIRER